jgi:hypothetical protein
MIDNKTKAISGNRVSIEVEILQSVGNKKAGVSKRKERITGYYRTESLLKITAKTDKTTF